MRQVESQNAESQEVESQELESQDLESDAALPMKSLTICADDYALSPAVSLGIRKCLAAGRVTATSAMTNRPSWPQAARELRAMSGTFEVGLHLNLTCGEPLGEMPVLAPGGSLPDARALMRSKAPQAEIRLEIIRQLQAFHTHMGRWPDFLDGHQHVHVLPNVRAALWQALADLDLKGQLWLRNSSDRLNRILIRGVQVKKALIVKALARGFAKEAERHGFETNDSFAGFSAFDVNGNYASDFARYLKAPGKRHLIMCHPGYVDDELRAADTLQEARVRELEFFTQ